MDQLSQITNEFYYRIYKNIDTGQDYLNWSYVCIDYGIEAKSVLQLASLKSTESLFIFKEYFDKSINEMRLKIPTLEECSRAMIVKYCKEIMSETSRDKFEIVRDIFSIVTHDLDYDQEFSAWLELDDSIDSIIYEDEYYKPDEVELRNLIVKEARKLLASQEAEDSR